MISPEDLSLLQPADDPQTAFEILRDFLTTHHLVPETPQEHEGAGHREDAGVERRGARLHAAC